MEMFPSTDEAKRGVSWCWCVAICLLLETLQRFFLVRAFLVTRIASPKERGLVDSISNRTSALTVSHPSLKHRNLNLFNSRTNLALT